MVKSNNGKSPIEVGAATWIDTKPGLYQPQDEEQVEVRGWGERAKGQTKTERSAVPQLPMVEGGGPRLPLGEGATSR